MKNLLLIICLFLIQPMVGQNFYIHIGPTEIEFEVLEYQTDTLLYINLHNNEITSIAAIKQVLPMKYGKFIGLKSGGTREVALAEDGKKLLFDPNRIFTSSGIEKTLKNYNCYSTTNENYVKNFSSLLLMKLVGAKLIVALHNNSDGGFSALLYQNQKKIKKDVLDVYLNPKMDEDDFYYVTRRSFFEYFKNQGYNVVLQDNVHVEDDGSLSVWCARKKLDYINIECQTGHVEEQIRMIKEIYAMSDLQKN